MSFLGQLNFGYPVVSQNIIATIPDNAVLPFSIGNSLQGNILGVTFGDLKSQVTPTFTNCNIAFGEDALSSITTGVNNIGIGCKSLENNTTGSINIAIGKNALRNTISGQQNIGIGVDTLYDNTTGFQNIAIGNNSLLKNTSGENNVAIGVVSMLFNTTGINNTAIGPFTLYNITTGRDNVAVGLGALGGLTTGSYNTGVGFETYAGNYSSCVLLGRRATATGDNQFSVGSINNPAGAVVSETNSSTYVWNVIINGVARKILLA